MLFAHCVGMIPRHNSSTFLPACIFLVKDGYAPSALMGADAERACRLQERRSLFFIGADLVFIGRAWLR
jgi:hypothetical protein